MSSKLNAIDNKYKDGLPLDTVQRIRRSLEEIGLEINETSEEESASGVNGAYWISLRAYRNGFLVGASNGKGTTPDFAKASAYAELAERLTNYCTRVDVDAYTQFEANKRIRNKAGFVCSPGEKEIDLSEMIKQDPITQQFLRTFPLELINDVIKSRKFVDERKKILCVPLYNYFNKEKDVIYSNLKIYHHIVGSTGLCAGNTEEEAINQGISEIMERYVQWLTLTGELKVYKMTDQFLSRFPSYFDSIQEIRSKGFDYQVIDCSGSGLPIMCSVITSPITMQYYVRFGCFPILDIAIERCLTELMQGVSVSNMTEFFPKTVPFRACDKNYEYEKAIINGTGMLNEQILVAEYANELKAPEVFVSKSYSNNEMINYWKEICERSGWDMYCFDASPQFLKTYTLIIPQLIAPYQSYNMTSRQAREFAYIFCNALEKEDYGFLTSVDCINHYKRYVDFSLTAIGDILIWPLIHQINGVAVFMYFGFVLTFMAGDYKMSLDYLEGFINDSKLEPFIDRKLVNFISLYMQYVLCNKYSKEEIKEILQQLSGEVDENRSIDVFNDKNKMAKILLTDFVKQPQAMGAKQAYEDYLVDLNRSKLKD